MSDIDPDDLVTALSDGLRRWLPAQRWFDSSAGPIEAVVPRRLETLRRRWPLLLWSPTEVVHRGGRRVTYQLLLGVRPDADGIEPDAIIGEVPAPEGRAVVYDALVDPELCVEFAEMVMPGVEMRRPSALPGDYSNTSVVFEQRWILKLFRRLEDGPNPDVEITEALASTDGGDIVAPVAVWRRGDADLAVIRAFHPRAVNGWDLAEASLEEMFRRRVKPRETTTDFGPEAATLGRAVARVHVALAEAFGTGPADGEVLAEAMVQHLRRVVPPGVDLDAVEKVYRRLGGLEDLGEVLRVHGDLHLAQALRLRRGWVVIDFEGEPARPLSERRAPSSPLRDVAGMLRSFQYASQMALDSADRLDPEGDADHDPELAHLAESWADRATDAFLTGYTSIDGVHALLPRDRRARDALLTVFELDKAVYELAYEVGHRPHLAHIPRGAVDVLLRDDDRRRW